MQQSGQSANRRAEVETLVLLLFDPVDRAAWLRALKAAKRLI
jgi:hypothetical protein